jgi:L-fuconolactonase
MEQWHLDIAEVAACPNVVMKVGGIGMTVYGAGWESGERPPSSDAIVDYWGEPISFVIDRFGADRCMFESNFPVDKQSCSYRTLWNAFKKMSADRSPADRANLFQGTADRVYRTV